MCARFRSLFVMPCRMRARGAAAIGLPSKARGHFFAVSFADLTERQGIPLQKAPPSSLTCLTFSRFCVILIEIDRKRLKSTGTGRDKEKKQV